MSTNIEKSQQNEDVPCFNGNANMIEKFGELYLRNMLEGENNFIEMEGELKGNYVTNFGRLFRTNNTITNKDLNSHGQLKINFKVNGKAFQFTLNKLIANSFGKKETNINKYIYYLDHNPRNNKIENLEFSTENARTENWTILKENLLGDQIEELKNLTEFPNYQFSKFGYFYDKNDGKLLFPTTISGSHFAFQPLLNKQKKTLLIYETLAKLYLPDFIEKIDKEKIIYKDKKEIIFLNGDFLDVRVENLSVKNSNIQKESILKDFENEGWTKIEGYSKYEISYAGKIRPIGGKIFSNENNIHVTLINDENISKSRQCIDKLSVLTFFKTEMTIPYKYLIVSHKDDDPKNNHYKNLEYLDLRNNNESTTKISTIPSAIKNKITVEYILSIISKNFNVKTPKSFDTGVEVTLKNKKVKRIRIKTLTCINSKDNGRPYSYNFNCGNYDLKTLILAVNEERNFFVVIFKENIGTAKNINFLINPSDGDKYKYKKYIFKNEEDFLENFKEKIKECVNSGEENIEPLNLKK